MTPFMRRPTGTRLIGSISAGFTGQSKIPWYKYHLWLLKLARRNMLKFERPEGGGAMFYRY